MDGITVKRENRITIIINQSKINAILLDYVRSKYGDAISHRATCQIRYAPDESFEAFIREDMPGNIIIAADEED